MSSSPSDSGVAPSSQKVWHRYIPRSPSPRKPRRSRRRSAASKLASLTPSWFLTRSRSSLLEKYVRTRPLGSLSA